MLFKEPRTLTFYGQIFIIIIIVPSRKRAINLSLFMTIRFTFYQNTTKMFVGYTVLHVGKYHLT